MSHHRIVVVFSAVIFALQLVATDCVAGDQYQWRELIAPQGDRFQNVYGIEVTEDAIYYSSVDDHSVWKSRHDGTWLERMAGTGKQGYSGDGGHAKLATFNAPHEIRVDDVGNVFVADTRNHCIRRIDADTGEINTIAGDGVAGDRGDGGLALDARFNQPHSIVLDGAGGLLIADTKNHRVRRIDLKSNRITTWAGDGKAKLPGEGMQAQATSVFGPRSLAVSKDAFWLVLREGNSVWRIDRQTQLMTRVAGTGKKGYSGDGGDPLLATFRGPKGIAVDGSGKLLIVDTENQTLRLVDPRAKTIGSLARDWKLKRPHGVASLPVIGDQDRYLLSDSENHRVLIGHRK